MDARTFSIILIAVVLAGCGEREGLRCPDTQGATDPSALPAAGTVQFPPNIEGFQGALAVEDGEGWAAVKATSGALEVWEFGFADGAARRLAVPGLAGAHTAAVAQREGVLAVGHTGGPGSIGKVEILRRVDSDWKFQETLRESGQATAGREFGTSVAFHDNILWVGNPGTKAGCNGPYGCQGVLHAYQVSNASVEHLQTVPFNPTDHRFNYIAQFGRQFSVRGEVLAVSMPNADTHSLRLLGAYGRPADPAPDRSLEGALYIFHANGTAWEIQQMILPYSKGGLLPISYGAAVATDGTYVAVGSPVTLRHGSSSQDARAPGIVFIYDGATGALLQTLQAPRPQSDDGFGWSLAFSNGLLAVGAPGEAGARGDQNSAHFCTPGAGYTFREVDGKWVLDRQLQSTGPRFGEILVPGGEGFAVGSVTSPGPISLFEV